MRALLLSHLIQLMQLPSPELSKFGHENPEVSEGKMSVNDLEFSTNIKRWKDDVDV